MLQIYFSNVWANEADRIIKEAINLAVSVFNCLFKTYLWIVEHLFYDCILTSNLRDLYVYYTGDIVTAEWID